MKACFALGVVLAAMLTSAAGAQVIYEPVRYQYGQYGEVFYGGRNPTFTSNAYVYLPPALQAAYAAHRLDTPPYLNGYSNGSNFVSPFTPTSTMSNPVYTPYVFSDFLPYQEVGQFGYTIDDARNEAYSNVARIQTAHRGPTAPAPANAAKGNDTNNAPAAAATPPTPPADPKLKAIPLLNWAKVERVKNPPLYNALLKEARKYDPAATDKFEQSVASDK